MRNSLFFIIVGFLCVICLFFVTKIHGGIGDDNTISWSRNDSVLSISGTGEMQNYACDEFRFQNMAPWSEYSSEIRCVVVQNGVVNIGENAFFYFIDLRSITIPASVTSIGLGAFKYCINLTSITIPASVTSIGMEAFSSCSELSSVTIPASITSIDNSTFSRCYSLKSVTIPNSVKNIGKNAFYHCRNLPSITLPRSIKSIGEGAFYDCCGLTEIMVRAKRPPCIYSDTFHGVSDTIPVYVPEKSLAAYRNAPYWNKLNLQAIQE